MSHMMHDPLYPLHAETDQDLFTVPSLRIDLSLFLGSDLDLFEAGRLDDETDAERRARLDAAADMLAEPDLYAPYGAMDEADQADASGGLVLAFTDCRATEALAVAA